LPAAEIALAEIYRFDGFPVPRDVTLAMPWYEKAAESDAVSQTTLGQKYEFGDGDLFRPDHTSAARWYLRAAVQGFPPAERRVADTYSSGDGVPMDKAIATQTYHKRDEWPADVRLAITQFLCNGLDLNFAPKCLKAWLPKEISALQRK